MLERPKIGSLSPFALRAPLSPVLDVLSLLAGGDPSPIDVHYIVVRHVIMSNSYVLPVILALVHDRLKRLWNVVEHRHVQTFTSYILTHPYTLSSSLTSRHLVSDYVCCYHYHISVFEVFFRCTISDVYFELRSTFSS